MSLLATVLCVEKELLHTDVLFADAIYVSKPHGLEGGWMSRGATRCKGKKRIVSLGKVIATFAVI